MAASIGMSAKASGIALLPYLLATALTSISTALLTTRTCLPQKTAVAIFAITGCGIAMLAAGLLITVDAHTLSSRVTGFQIMFGIGMGLAIQQGQNALQFELKQDDLMMGMTLVQFYQSLGGAIAGAAGEAVFVEIMRAAARQTPAGVDVGQVAAAGITAFRSLPVWCLESWLSAYDGAFHATFALVCALAGLALIGSCFMKTDGLKKRKTSA
ncbi:hypothetical protein LTR65_008332 [Meristemomyces frigidus]